MHAFRFPLFIDILCFAKEIEPSEFSARLPSWPHARLLVVWGQVCPRFVALSFAHVQALCVCIFLCMCVCMYVCVRVSMYICMYVCLHACVYECMIVGVFAFIYRLRHVWLLLFTSHKF